MKSLSLVDILESESQTCATILGELVAKGTLEVYEEDLYLLAIECCKCGIALRVISFSKGIFLVSL